MQITDLYQTKITCNKYDANIDSTDTVVTVKLIDFNNNPVKNKSVTLTVDKGYFNKNGNTSISGTTTKSITATTNTNGEITATYTASEWGLATFSANNNNIQIRIKGWKTVYGGTDVHCKYNEDTVILRISTGEIPFYTTWGPFDNYQIPQNLRPSTIITAPNYNFPEHLFIAVNIDGRIYRVSTSPNGTIRTTAWAFFTWNY